MVNNEIHQHILKYNGPLHDWFAKRRRALPLPIYTSIDVRDSSFKVASVDANIYPAGFNNICPTDKEHAPEIFKSYIENFYGTEIKKIGLITEEHTKNAYYWENVFWLNQMIREAGYDYRNVFPRESDKDLDVESASGQKIKVSHAKKKGGNIEFADGFVPDLLISNNDFSEERREWIEGLKIPINPPQELGWFQRKKSQHFEFYNELAQEFANTIQIDPWQFLIQTEVFKDFNSNDVDSRNLLADRVDQMLSKIRAEYERRKIKSEPTIFIKNNSGTYGLAVLAVNSGNEVREWNNKLRTKMKAAKGGGSVSEVIIQEGIPTTVTADGYTAEPVVYIVGCELAGAFFRAHQEKGPNDSLNSPGAVYKRMCVSDLKMTPEDRMYENVYGWVARLSSMAVGEEMRALGFNLPGCK